jgi:multidrug efflux pump subunit AcrA (membrane-fusion protein)
MKDLYMNITQSFSVISFIKKQWLNHKPSIKSFLQSRKALPIIAFIGVLLLIMIIKSQPDLQHNNTERLSVAVNYIEVKNYQVKPEIIGYGVVQPDLNLQAKAEVTGRVVYSHPKLKKGEIFSKGTLLLKIDDKDYLLQLKQSQADLLANKANLEEMKINIENNQLELKLAIEKLTVRQKEYARLKKLRRSGAVSQSNLDGERQNLLQQKQEVQQLKNRQTTLPSTLEVMKAQLEISKAKLEKSQRDLDRTQVKIPFNGRISDVYTDLDQYMQTGTSLFDATGLNKIMINAQFPVDQFSSFAKNFDPKKLDFKDQKEIPSMSHVLASLNLTSTVEEAGGDFKNWQAKVERFSDDLDPKSRTVGVIVTVSDSYKNLQPGTRPPLLEGMYMKAFLQGASVNRLVIPRFALHENQVYTINQENQLKRIILTQYQQQGELVLLTELSGIKAGDKIITSDVFPAVNNMKVTPIIDQLATKKINDWVGVNK